MSGAPTHAWGDVTCCPIPVPSPGIRGWDTAHPKRPLPGHSLHPQPTHWGQAAWAGLLPPSTTPHHLLPPWGTGAAPGGPHGTKPPRAQFPGDGEGDGEAGAAAAAQLLWAQVLLRSPPSTWPCQEFVPSRHGLTSPVYRSPLQTRSASGRCWPRGPAPNTRAFVFASSSCPPRAPLGVPVSPARSGGDVRLLRLCAVDVPHLLMLFLAALSLLLLSIPILSPSAEQCGPTSLETLENKHDPPNPFATDTRALPASVQHHHPQRPSPPCHHHVLLWLRGSLCKFSFFLWGRGRSPPWLGPGASFHPRARLSPGSVRSTSEQNVSLV